SGCAGRSGVVTGMILTLILIINKQHNTGYL
ncbi:conjugal transfer protein, partial [Shigella sonnei]|nr:conjugal transfer protein [Shigella sonnei]